MSDSLRILGYVEHSHAPAPASAHTLCLFCLSVLLSFQKSADAERRRQKPRAEAQENIRLSSSLGVLELNAEAGKAYMAFEEKKKKNEERQCLASPLATSALHVGLLK